MRLTTGIYSRGPGGLMEGWVMGDSGVSRRDFLRISGTAGAGLFFIGRVGGELFRLPVAAAAIPGGTLDPVRVPKYRTRLLIPPVMPRAGTIAMPGGKPVDYYEISMKQICQQILPAGLPATTVWGYGAVKAQSKRGLLLHNAPSLTIEAQYNRPVQVKWINDLVDENGHFLPHLLPVDPTLHWANPRGGAVGRDSRPTFTSTPARYTGPVPIVTHAHGAVDVGDESDGYAEAWFLPAADDIPSGYATEGTWYDFFSRKAAARFGVTWGIRVRDLPVPQPWARGDHVVPRPCARHDPAERVRRPGRLLHHPRRAKWRCRRARRSYRSSRFSAWAGPT
jgi:hypothetical protein